MQVSLCCTQKKYKITYYPNIKHVWKPSFWLLVWDGKIPNWVIKTLLYRSVVSKLWVVTYLWVSDSFLASLNFVGQCTKITNIINQSNIIALVAHRHSFTPPRCRTSQYRRSFVPFSVSLWNDLSDRVWWYGTGGFQENSQCFPVGMICPFFFVFYCFIFFFLPWVGCVGLGSLDW